MSRFDMWWYEIGSGILTKESDDIEEHAKRVSHQLYLWMTSNFVGNGRH
jgi:hypothetical protein